MKRALVLLLLLQMVVAAADELKVKPTNSDEVIHVTTALDHLTVLEFGEAVTMAAAGSPLFQIERHENKVFIKPLKAGVSTDLFVWTASRRFAYELEPPGEVNNMNFAVDSRIPAPGPAPESGAQLEETADMMLTRALLAAERVDSSSIKDGKNQITVRIQQLFQSRNTLYLQYSVRNQSRRPYRVTAPAVVLLLASRPTISLLSFHRTQIETQILKKFGQLQERPVTVSRAEIQKEDLQPGEQIQGVIALREQLSSPAILQLTFGPAESHKVLATLSF
ncbi:MAG TPA: TrbG/VirB9 family P-type conjugative transfer protein [Candidatus Angelobacter sp.]|nr:TrbG/VirB9 family P-type conjugative transfer protein [Candidatus Angelobacter sp.]